MKNKGFTLVELLAVITLMALLSLAAFELLDSVNKGNREKAEEVQIKNILAGAISHVSSSNILLPNTDYFNQNCLRNSNEYIEATYGESEPPSNASKKNICMTRINLQYFVSKGVLEEDIVNPQTGMLYDITDSDVKIMYVTKDNKDRVEDFVKGYGDYWKYDGVYLYFLDYKDSSCPKDYKDYPDKYEKDSSGKCKLKS